MRGKTEVASKGGKELKVILKVCWKKKGLCKGVEGGMGENK